MLLQSGFKTPTTDRHCTSRESERLLTLLVPTEALPDWLHLADNLADGTSNFFRVTVRFDISNQQHNNDCDWLQPPFTNCSFLLLLSLLISMKICMCWRSSSISGCGQQLWFNQLNKGRQQLKWPTPSWYLKIIINSNGYSRDWGTLIDTPKWCGTATVLLLVL